jgi:hypothetical protein
MGPTVPHLEQTGKCRDLYAADSRIQSGDLHMSDRLARWLAVCVACGQVHEWTVIIAETPSGISHSRN